MKCGRLGSDSATAAVGRRRNPTCPSYAKGGDYTPEMLPETPLVRQLGGEVRTLGYLSRRSSSQIIDRIRAGAERQ